MGNILFQIMGTMDLISAAVLLLMHYDFIGWRLGFVMTCYLFLKAYAFRDDIASIIDGVCGVWMLLVMFGVTFGLTFIVAFYLLQKAVISFF